MSVLEHLKEFIQSSNIRLQYRDVLEVNEYMLRTFLDQHQPVDTSLPNIEVTYDADGDLVDKDNRIYDKDRKICIGEKKGNEKIMYKIV